MHIIGALAAGVNGAGDGYARIYNRGTSTLATVYSDYTGTVVAPGTNGFLLDANGGRTLYVNAEVDITVTDSTGTSVRAWTEMYAAPNGEVRSQSFTGTDYDSAATGASKPTTLQAALDSWFDSAGARDFEVLFDGTSTRIQDALGGITNVFYNVKSPEFGALGDGATDDTTPIQAAITAARTAGGGIVLFPNGTYRITSALSCYAKVNLWGTSAVGSIIATDHATANTLEFSGVVASIGYDDVRALTLKASQTNTGYRVKVTNDAIRNVRISACKIGESNSTGAYTVWADDMASRIVIEDSDVYAGGASSGAVTMNGNGPWLILRNSRFYSITAAYDGALVSCANIQASQCEFDLSASSSASVGMYAVQLGGSSASTVLGSVVGCRFKPPGGGTCYALYLASANAAATFITESACQFKTGFTYNLYGWTSSSNDPHIKSQTRDAFKQSLPSDAATLAVDPDQYGITVITRTSNGNQTLNCTAVPPNGSFYTLRVFQSSGGAGGTITFGSGFIATTPTISALANGTSGIYLFRAEYAGGVNALVPQGLQIKTT